MTKKLLISQIMASTRLQYTIIGACMLITTLCVIHEVLDMNVLRVPKSATSGSTTGRVSSPERSVNVSSPERTVNVSSPERTGREHSPVVTVGMPSDIRTSGGSLNRSDGCHRLWIKGKSQWFDKRFNFSLSPLWSLKNKDFEQHIRRWWLGLQQNSHGDEPLEKALEKALENIFDLIPTGDPYGTRDLTKCLRCAVVGNSGNLRDSQYGKLIDSHNMVIRINKAVVKGFEEDVGTKETHRIMYPESAIDLKNDTHFVLAAFKIKDIMWMASALTDGSISRTYKPVRRKINTHKSKVMVFNPALMYQIHTVWENGKGRYPSTGAIAIFLALHACDEVNVFGFGPTKNGNWDHYWDPPIDDKKVDAFRKTGVHSGDTEKELWQQLEREGKLKLYLGNR